VQGVLIPGSRGAVPIDLSQCIAALLVWPAVRDEAARAHNQCTAEYLLGTPLLGDFLEAGLSMLGYSCKEFEIERL
jgi:Protein of unknown function (DUF3775)